MRQCCGNCKYFDPVVGDGYEDTGETGMCKRQSYYLYWVSTHIDSCCLKFQKKEGDAMPTE